MPCMSAAQNQKQTRDLAAGDRVLLRGEEVTVERVTVADGWATDGWVDRVAVRLADGRCWVVANTTHLL